MIENHGLRLMNNDLHDQLIRVLFRMQRVSTGLPDACAIRMSELLILRAIRDNISCLDKNYVSDVWSDLSISKSAVSQSLGVLEKKGLIHREMDKDDRRKILVTLTKQGETVLHQAEKESRQMFEAIVSRVGEDKVRELFDLFTIFTDTVETLKQEALNESA
jgi:DNA-binding MarR family transcriptional regulator